MLTGQPFSKVLPSCLDGGRSHNYSSLISRNKVTCLFGISAPCPLDLIMASQEKPYPGHLTLFNPPLSGYSIANFRLQKKTVQLPSQPAPPAFLPHPLVSRMAGPESYRCCLWTFFSTEVCTILSRSFSCLSFLSFFSLVPCWGSRCEGSPMEASPYSSLPFCPAMPPSTPLGPRVTLTETKSPWCSCHHLLINLGWDSHSPFWKLSFWLLPGWLLRKPG